MAPTSPGGYTRQEIDQAAEWIDPRRDDLLDYPGLDLLLKRYVVCSHDHIPLESPHEMFMGIALHLALRERRESRMGWVRSFYDMLSRLEVTMATPTLSNARKPHHQLSSCFIDTVPDGLEGIYRQRGQLCDGVQVWRRHGHVPGQGSRQGREHPGL